MSLTHGFKVILELSKSRRDSQLSHVWLIMHEKRATSHFLFSIAYTHLPLHSKILPRQTRYIQFRSIQYVELAKLLWKNFKHEQVHHIGFNSFSVHFINIGIGLCCRTCHNNRWKIQHIYNEVKVRHVLLERVSQVRPIHVGGRHIKTFSCLSTFGF